MLPLLSVQDLQVDFTNGEKVHTAVKKVSFTVNRGEILAIVGESGSGKSVTSLSILQLLNSSHVKYPNGEILLSPDGETFIDILQLAPKELQGIRGNTVSMIFQEPMTSLNPVMKCGRQITEALRVHNNISMREAKAQAISWFNQVRLPQPSEIYDRYPHQLSGGQKQRVMIAMAMCCNPSLLICDEPTTALDASVQKSILDLILELRAKHNIGVIFISHDIEVVKSIANKIAIMYKGEMIQQNLTPSMLDHPGQAELQPYTRALLACRPELYPRGVRLPVVSDFLEGIRIPAEHTARDPITNRVPGGVLLEVKDVTVKYARKRNLLGKPVNEFVAVDHASLKIHKGETLGLVGESGCGKTTLGRTILGLVKPASGQVLFKGNDISSLIHKKDSEFHAKVQLVFQDPYSALNPRLEIGEAIAEPMHLSKKERTERAKKLLAQVSLPSPSFHRYPHEFSGGQRQRIVIARALGRNPELLVCDESVSALDVSIQAQILNLLNDLKRELNLTMLFISHDMNVVHYMCDRVIRMEKGRVMTDD